MPMRACQKVIAPRTGTSGAAPDAQIMSAAPAAAAKQLVHPAANAPAVLPARVSLTRTARL